VYLDWPTHQKENADISHRMLTINSMWFHFRSVAFDKQNQNHELVILL